MTDSMKFGPEWLRNMSTESANFGISSHNNSSNLSFSGSGNGSHHSTSNTSHMPAPRNMFPEFRYGREEMLSLFDKNCIMPQILPSFKKIFVEKVQYPLALTPSTDEETITPGPVIPTQRPTWIQRSPVGFNNSPRGTGRGGSVDRGRMRGKSVYHPIYQRPTAMFEDDLRTASLKSERGWSERNGAGDSLGSNSGTGSGALGTDWNGTPASSPRKEFSSHPRNMENWRRNRNEDGTSDASSSGLGSTEGWRGATTTNFGPTHRWGRSTSWRDEDIPPGTDGGNGITMQRSYSTITTVTERGGYVSNNLSKNSQSSTNYSGVNQPLSRALISTSGVNTQSRNNQWSSNSISTGGSSSGVDGEDNLPEWAMENPSDSGGTFDASGAFHGSVDDDDSTDGNKEKTNPSNRSCSESSTQCNESKLKTEDNYLLDKGNSIGHLSEVDVSLVSSSIECAEDSKKQKQHLCNNNTNIDSVRENISQTDTQTAEELQEPNLKKNIPSSEANSVLNTSTMPTTVPPVCNSNYFHAANDAPIGHLGESAQESHIDFSDRMKEVADYMIEKLIMDDDTVGINDNITDVKPNTTSMGTNALRMQNNFVSSAVVIKQRTQHQTGQSNVSVSPTISGNHKAIPLYGSGVVVDHATIQQHHMQTQQQQLATAAAASTATGLPHAMNSAPNSNELWYYRDPQSKVQGPFTAMEMTEWYRAGYFNENLFVRRLCDTCYRALGDLIKLCHGNMPFSHSHLIPMGLENIHVTNSSGIPPNKPQTLNDFGFKQQDEQHEELKSNVTAAADALSSAVKNVSSVDVSHMLNMHFQMLQDQYIRHQEMVIVTELSKNECFQRLTTSEREAVVRQKVQMLRLPEYLTSLTGLSNSLATLNPLAGNQLYDAIAECSKKDQLFAGGAQHQQQTTAANAYIDADDFILNSQHPQQQLQTQFSRGQGPYGSVLGPSNENNSAGKIIRGPESIPNNELLNEFNLQMFLRSNNASSQHVPQQQQQESQDFMGNVRSNDFLTEQPLLATAANPAQSPLMQMWMPQLASATNNSTQAQQQTQAQTQPQNNQWPNNLLVGMPVTVIPVTPKSMGITMWDVPPLEQGQQTQQKLEHNVMNFDEKKIQNLSQLLQSNEQKQRCVDAENLEELQLQMPSENQQQININNIPQSSTITKQRKDGSTEKQNSNKRNSKSHQTLATKTKDDNANNNRRNEEEHRRETTEEKRRQKEEKKRQQLEEEKRRLQQVEEQKRRQILEEKERQQQIQAHRRKALSSNAPTASISATNIEHTLSSPVVKQGKEQRVQSSIAPWSAQTIAAAGKTGPCLAEIQKAERKERRADQQRQTEMLEKQMRSNAAVTEANDSALKWNASPIQVKSFAEIQAEEAKRLANEHLEIQRRKEHEQHVAQVVSNSGTNTTGVGGAGSSNMSAIWSGTKAWGPTSTSGFWEEPIKFSGTASCNTTAAIIVASGMSNNNSGKQNQSTQQKATSSGQQSLNALRNLRKSQTVSVMQNTSPAIIAVKNSKVNNQLPSSSTAVKQNNRSQHPKTDADKIKGIIKIHNNNSLSVNNGAANKKDDFENEFTGWCTKSLNNMNTKVDVPTFVTFLQDLESPYEVKDYVRVYLGESKEYTEFAKQFLERRSKYKNLQRAQNAHNDDMCKPAPAITPSGNDNSDSKGKQKKVKKNKMTRLDARILGFSVTAAEGRINVGDRDYVDAP